MRETCGMSIRNISENTRLLHSKESSRDARARAWNTRDLRSRNFATDATCMFRIFFTNHNSSVGPRASVFSSVQYREGDRKGDTGLLHVPLHVFMCYFSGSQHLFLNSVSTRRDQVHVLRDQRRSSFWWITGVQYYFRFTFTTLVLRWSIHFIISWNTYYW